MALSFYNTLNRTREEFVPLEAGKVGIYACGPTVYDHPHIGNCRAFIFVDLLHRYLEWRGFEVRLVMNLTDVDDKTIRDSAAAGEPLREYTDRYITSFFEDLDALRVLRADVYPRATEHMEDMIDLVRELEEKGFAYSSAGSVYYPVKRFAGYGKLSGIDTSGLKAGARVDADEYEKEEVRDFVLWKGRKEEDGDVFWESPWGVGRPGWHLECSAMSRRYLGVPFDIHTGGVDLQFPHHENEIAQTEAASGVLPARVWLHNEHLLVEGRKMSKSIGNVYTLGDLVGQGHDPVAVRYLLMATHYRQQVNLKAEGVEAARASIARLNEAALLWHEQAGGGGDGNALEEEAVAVAQRAESAFADAMDADLNISEGLAAAFELVRRGNALLEKGVGPPGATRLLKALKGIDSVLGVLDEVEAGGRELDPDVMGLIERREEARRRKEWAESDRLRDELARRGVWLEDTPEGPRWKWSR